MYNLHNWDSLSLTLSLSLTIKITCTSFFVTQNLQNSILSIPHLHSCTIYHRRTKIAQNGYSLPQSSRNSRKDTPFASGTSDRYLIPSLSLSSPDKWLFTRVNDACAPPAVLNWRATHSRLSFIRASRAARVSVCTVYIRVKNRRFQFRVSIGVKFRGGNLCRVSERAWI